MPLEAPTHAHVGERVDVDGPVARREHQLAQGGTPVHPVHLGVEGGQGGWDPSASGTPGSEKRERGGKHA